MLSGYGWCVLRALPPGSADALEPDPDRVDALADEADERLWADFRTWMNENENQLVWVRWNLVEHNNNARGVLTFHVSRNHSAPEAWVMLRWIAEHGPGSYGLYFVHDDEDDGRAEGAVGVDHSNVFRVHRLRHGVFTEMDDPFFGPVFPDLEE